MKFAGSALPELAAFETQARMQLIAPPNVGLAGISRLGKPGWLFVQYAKVRFSQLRL
jgi:hypothetical protein